MATTSGLTVWVTSRAIAAMVRVIAAKTSLLMARTCVDVKFKDDQS